MTADHTEMLHAPAVAALTGAPEGTLRYWASIGRGPRSFKIGRRRVWRKSDVLAWIAAQEEATASGGVA